MPKRETDKKETIREITEIVSQRILEMPIGSETAISWLVNDVYRQRGYNLVHCGWRIGYAWSKDGGKTYSLSASEEGEVLCKVERKLWKERYLDFSEHEGLFEGLPENLDFVIRPAEMRPRKKYTRGGK